MNGVLVPDLIDAGFRGEIISTHATKALLIPMLHDAMSFSDRTGKRHLFCGIPGKGNTRKAND